MLNLCKAKFEFVQDGNTNGTTGDYEQLIVDMESPLYLDTDGGFFVLRTEGWSIDCFDELEDLLSTIEIGVGVVSTGVRSANKRLEQADNT